MKYLQEGPLCYVPQTNTKYYDMEVKKAFKQDVIIESPIINQDIESSVRHGSAFLMLFSMLLHFT